MRLPDLIHLHGQKHFRIIPSVFPAINFFEDLVDPSEMETLWEIESLTNERIRQEVGDISLVSAQDRVSGPGSSVVMASFTHIHRPSRFTDGSFGIYYAGLSQETAIRETVYHREQFMRATHEPASEITMRLYAGKIIQPLHDIRKSKFNYLHDPNDYSESQKWGFLLKQKNTWGLIYHSVRHPAGFCVAIFRPTATSIPVAVTHLRYIWNGDRIVEVLDTRSLMQLE